MARAGDAVQARRLRCAVYTRKSSEEGLEQEFNSLRRGMKPISYRGYRFRAAIWSPASKPVLVVG